MKLITTDAQLRAHIPNIIASVKGETPFIERVAHFLDLAEDWVRTTFTSESTFNTICGYTDSNEIKIICSRLVVADALRRAIPSLDIVLTPNGFGVVNTSNLAPASKPRVDRLVGSMLAHRDDCIAALLPEIVGASKWLTSDRADFFGATLYMKRNLLILILALLTCLTSFGQATKRERNLIKQGNEYFNKKQYSKAEESYSRVLEINPNSQIAKYNLGSTMLRQRGGNSEKDVARDSLISRYLSDVGSNTSAPASLRAHSFYNLGKLP